MKPIYLAAAMLLLSSACKQAGQKTDKSDYQARPVFRLYDDPNRFADIEMLRYEVSGFENLSLKQKELVYYLSEAALCGRDIIYDQNNKHNLRLRKTLEELYVHYKGDKKSEEFRRFEVYLKRIWMSNGIHHHYAENKIHPEFSSGFLMELLNHASGAKLPYFSDRDSAAFRLWLSDLIFNPASEAKRVNKTEGEDPVLTSANNFYEGVNQAEVEQFYKNRKALDSQSLISWGGNSKLIKTDQGIMEKTWKAGGMYGTAIEKMIGWLEKAVSVAETPEQSEALKLLIAFYRSGDLKDWDNYNIAWVKDVNSSIDVINGFIEVYHDPLGMRANFESAVQISDAEASRRMAILARNAQWFEDHSPIDPKFKKANVVGISYKVVNVAMEGGDLSPSTAIGINLPNAEWIREKHGSKSVSLGNIVAAYNQANSGDMLKEFCWDSMEVKRAGAHGQLAAKLHTALHEVIGHASGVMNKGISKDHLGQYGSTLEEARADLVALYYIMDEKLIALGMIPSLETGMAAYDEYIRNGLMVQLRRLQAGENIEEDHMRNRQMVAAWVYEAGRKDNVIEKKIRKGKTFFVINDYQKLRVLFGMLLNKIQSIKSTGDFAKGKALVEKYGVKPDRNLHTEVLKRTQSLNIAAYRGFIQPRMTPVYTNGKLSDVRIDYLESFTDQMLRYSRDYSFLPFDN